MLGGRNALGRRDLSSPLAFVNAQSEAVKRRLFYIDRWLYHIKGNRAWREEERWNEAVRVVHFLSRPRGAGWSWNVFHLAFLWRPSARIAASFVLLLTHGDVYKFQ